MSLAWLHYCLLCAACLGNPMILGGDCSSEKIVGRSITSMFFNNPSWEEMGQVSVFWDRFRVLRVSSSVRWGKGRNCSNVPLMPLPESSMDFRSISKASLGGITRPWKWLPCRTNKFCTRPRLQAWAVVNQLHSDLSGSKAQSVA